MVGTAIANAAVKSLNRIVPLLPETSRYYNAPAFGIASLTRLDYASAMLFFGDAAAAWLIPIQPRSNAEFPFSAWPQCNISEHKFGV